ncbi:MAG: hypothetical protein MZW92_48560 [Comamonadaceae bacterium]|nr:hypothetical protein [Comamonadaceae bacterium]
MADGAPPRVARASRSARPRRHPREPPRRRTGRPRGGSVRAAAPGRRQPRRARPRRLGRAVSRPGPPLRTARADRRRRPRGLRRRPGRPWRTRDHEPRRAADCGCSCAGPCCRGCSDSSFRRAALRARPDAAGALLPGTGSRRRPTHRHRVGRLRRAAQPVHRRAARRHRPRAGAHRAGDAVRAAAAPAAAGAGAGLSRAAWPSSCWCRGAAAA